MKSFFKLIRIILIILSYLSVSFSIFSWISGLQFKGSEFLPILMSTLTNLFCFSLYKVLNLKIFSTVHKTKSKSLKLLAQMGFYANLIFLGLCIFIIIGFGIIP